MRETASVDKIINATDQSHVFVTYWALPTQDKTHNLSTGLEAATGLIGVTKTFQAR